MRKVWARLGWILSLPAVVATAVAASSSAIPSDVPVPKDLKLPADIPAAIYLPASRREAHPLFWGMGDVESGRTLEDEVGEIGPLFFASTHLIDPGDDRSHALAIALHPDLSVDGQTITFKVHYKVFDAEAHPLLDAEKSASLTVGPFSGGGDVIGKLSQRAMLLAFADIVTQLRPDATRFPSTGSFKDRPLDLLANRDKPVSSATGFYFNANGQVMTAAHVVRHCIAIDTAHESQVVPATVVASSDLLDLAVLDTHVATTQYLRFRRGERYELGETVTAVGYPLQPVLAATPTLTRGNISSQAGLQGSVGQLQFSAPIQPGSSGGPLVSEAGELLGFAVATLNGNAIAVPTQNVNFALEARYAAQFLRLHRLAFDEVEPGGKADLHTATTAALGAVVSVKCYE